MKYKPNSPEAIAWGSLTLPEAWYVLKSKKLSDYYMKKYNRVNIDATFDNAYYHAMWNAAMTYYIGSEKAEMIATAHELQLSYSNPDAMLVSRDGYTNADRTEMDLQNNEVGRKAGLFALQNGWTLDDLADYLNDDRLLYSL